MTNPIDAVRVASTDDLKEGEPFCATANGKALALFRAGDKFYATDNACPHAGGPLCEGALHNGLVTCPWHGSQFKIETGEVVKGPSKTGVASYPVEVRGREVFVTLGRAAGAAKPKAATFTFEPTFNRDRPFSNEGFVTELLQGLKFPFKLYGQLPLVVIAQSPDEVDVYLGEVHITEVDLQTLSGVMAALNAKWKTSITYCLFHSAQFPGAMLLNIRGPQAPMDMENTAQY